MEKDDIIEKAVQYILSTDQTPYKIEQAIGISRMAIGNYKKRKSRPTLVNANAIISYFENLDQSEDQVENRDILVMNDDVKNRLDETYRYLVGKKIVSTKKEVAERMEYDYTTISSAFNGRRGNLTKNFVVAYNKAFGSIFNLGWILEGEGSMLNATIDDAISIECEAVGKTGCDHMQPILDIRVCAGNGIGLEGDENKIMEWVSIPAFKGCKGIMVFGDSMYDKYKSGDVIFVRPIQGRDDVDYGQCYVVITQEDRYIKNLYESPKGDGYVTMVSYNMELNPDGRRKFPDRDIPKSEILFLYKVAGKLRRNQL